jgi:hypothetical protein
MHAEHNIGYALEDLKTGVRNRAIRQGLRRTGPVGVKAAKTKLTRKSLAALAKSMGFTIKMYRKGEAYVLVVGPRRGFDTTKEIPNAGKTGVVTRKFGPTYIGWIIQMGRGPSVAKKKKFLAIPFDNGNEWKFRRAVKGTQPIKYMDAAFAAMKHWADEYLSEEFIRQVSLIEAKYASKGKSIYR